MYFLKDRIVGFLKHYLIAVLIWMVLRLGFYLTNAASFDLSEHGLLYFIFHGLRYDLAAICAINILMVLGYLLPIRMSKAYATIMTSIFTVTNGTAILLELADWGYFPYNHKRATFDVFTLVGNGADFANQLPTFFRNYWYLFCIALLLLALLWWMSYQINERLMDKEKQYSINYKTVIGQVVTIIIASGLSVLGVRGGTQLIPINIRDAITVASNDHVPLVLNTTFSVMTTIQSDKMERITYMDDITARNINATIHTPATDQVFVPKNVVVIVLESFTKGFTALEDKDKSVTPFLDSIMARSLTFTDAYANALHSNQGVPAIVSGIPGLMDQSFITTIYANNKIASIPNLLKQKGYQTAFYHGATNGSMSFDVYAKNAGYDLYFGRKEYNNEADFDGNWGIWDEPFLQRVAQEMNQLKPPFHALVFNINSHPPYDLPKEHQRTFQHIGGSPIYKSVAYADYSYRKMFEQLREMPWFKETIFVFVADHTSPVFDDQYYTAGLGKFQIPIAFYDPSGSYIQPEYKNQSIAQMDILPTLMNVLHYDQPFYALGKNVLANEATIITKNGNAHIFIAEGIRIVVENGAITQAYLHPSDHLGEHNVAADPAYKEQLKRVFTQYQALIQVYNNDMIDDKMTVTK